MPGYCTISLLYISLVTSESLNFCDTPSHLSSYFFPWKEVRMMLKWSNKDYLKKENIFEKNVSPFSLLFHINSIFFQLTLRLQEVIP